MEKYIQCVGDVMYKKKYVYKSFSIKIPKKIPKYFSKNPLFSVCFSRELRI